MDNKTSGNLKDDLYLKVWEMDKSYLQARWTITTFFMSVSFAIFGFSLQSQAGSALLLMVQQVAALAIYWFAYFLNLRFYDYTNFLRKYLEELEKSKQTSLDLQIKGEEFMSKQGRPSTTRMLLYFGIAYSVGTLAIWLFVLLP